MTISEEQEQARNLETILKKLRDRSYAMKLQAYLVLSTIVATISVGSYIFYFAEELSTRNINELVTGLNSEIGKMTVASVEYGSLFEQYASNVEDIQLSLQIVKNRISSTEISAANIAASLQSAKSVFVDDGFQHLLTNVTQKLADEAEQITAQRLSDLLLQTGMILERCVAARSAPNSNVLLSCPDIGQVIEVADFEIAYLEEANRIVGEVFEEQPMINIGDALTELDALSTQIVDNSREYIGFANVASQISLPTPLEPEVFRAQVSSIESTRESLESALSQVLEVDNTWIGFSRSISIRITIIALIIFLVQVLVNLFRYSTRLGAFYDARGDALQMVVDSGLKLSVSELRQLISSMSPDGLDFGRSPRSPVESGVEIASQIIAAAKVTK